MLYYKSLHCMRLLKINLYLVLENFDIVLELNILEKLTQLALNKFYVGLTYPIKQENNVPIL